MCVGASWDDENHFHQKRFSWSSLILNSRRKSASQSFHNFNVNKQQFFLDRQWELTLVPAFPVGWSKAPATLQFRFFSSTIFGPFLHYVMHFLPYRYSPICLPDRNVSFVKFLCDFLPKLSLLSRSAGTPRAASREALTTTASTGFRDRPMSSLGQSENLNTRVGVEMIQ